MTRLAPAVAPTERQSACPSQARRHRASREREPRPLPDRHVTVVPFLALGLVALAGLGLLLGWSDIASSDHVHAHRARVTVGFHRLFTHRSFEAKTVRGVLAALGSVAIEGPVISWVADHRKHHAFSDQPGDPHSPTSTTASAGAAR